MYGTCTWAIPMLSHEIIQIQSDLTKLKNNTGESQDSTEA